MALYLCVDCGGSKTSAVICNAAGDIVGRALGGPSNYAYLGPAAFLAAVKDAVSHALQTAVSPPSPEPVALPPSAPLFAAAWLGVSGVDSPADIATITPLVSALLHLDPGPKLSIGNDTHLLAAPLRLHPDIAHAVAVIAGTGSISVSFRQREDGTLAELGRVGGWGWMLGDEGGGFHVGREAVRQLLLETDRASVQEAQPAGSLRARVLERFGISHLLEILALVHLPDPDPAPGNGGEVPQYRSVPKEKRLSQLSPLVFAAAFEDGDPLALNVLRTCAGMLAEQISVLLSPDGDSQVAKNAVAAKESVVCFGGSLVGIEKYRKLVLDGLKERGHVFRYVEFVEDAAATGAAGLAAAATATATD
ncbi:hypothetical protein GLOTRDRAFT_110721 [Gloeophyllum trabeum ATCC 11539]|uniref:N-acetyl-D-glucosamine kinase n=1 Tax=Gloeophyllum trabeum (strain ATCC 11539 / FP-39264 / Madison 617) TaxID=670483 RepID=S7Q9Q0_GLOTA|nr:uncharacterized protein GLOTRDRAFT_110721 [Gloeophyllum trabeum ATCC 11539]EPQ56247.1 hypothetical protein GLOTRDRAFT_110721 [Gloeophyllum trabeum ATCC 11539]